MTLTVLIFILLSPVYADMGPKPSVSVKISGIEEEGYVTLLSKDGPTGPYKNRVYEEDIGPESAWKALESYVDEDEFTFANFMGKTENGEYTMGYYPPECFKVLIYFPWSNVYVVTRAFEREQFDTRIVVDIGEDALNTARGKTEGRVAVAEAREEYDRRGEIVAFSARAALTVLIEVLIAFLFGYRRQQFIVIAITNVLTQVALNIGLFHISTRHGLVYMILNYVILEMAVVIIECIVYSKTLHLVLDSDKKRHPCAYAIVANIISFALGMYLSLIWPSAF